MAMAPVTKRRRLLVDRRSQIYLSLLVVLYLVIYSVALLGFILLPSALKLTSKATPLEAQYEASREFLYLDQRVVPAVLVVMLLVGVHFIVISHRIFGPLVRFRRILEEWGTGSWPRPFKARPKDFHHDLFATFNMTTLELKEEIDAARNLLGPLQHDLEQAGSGRGLRPEETAALAGRLREIADRLGRFR